MDKEVKVTLTDGDLEKIGNVIDEKFKKYVGIVPNNKTLLQHVNEKISSLDIIGDCADLNNVVDFVIETKCKENPQEYREKARIYWREQKRKRG